MSDVRYRRSPHAVWRASASFLVAAVPPHPPTRVGGSASAVWALLAEPSSVDDVVQLLVAATGAPRDQVHSDVAALVADLLPLGLVEVTG